MNPIRRRMKKCNPSSGQNGQLVHWWLLVHSGQREQKSNGNRRGVGRREQKAEGLAATGMKKQAKNGIVIGADFCRSVRTLTTQSVRETYNPTVARSVSQGNQWVQASIQEMQVVLQFTFYNVNYCKIHVK